jgi:hypothetical protein
MGVNRKRLNGHDFYDVKIATRETEGGPLLVNP